MIQLLARNPRTSLLGSGCSRGEGGAKAVVVVTAHPGWGRLEDKSCPVSQTDDGFSERSNAVL